MSRSSMLARIRAAQVQGAPHQNTEEPIPRDYHQGSLIPAAELIALFDDRVRDYRAQVEVAAPHEVASRVAAALQHHGARVVGVPNGLDLHQWHHDGAELESEFEVRRDSRSDPLDLDQLQQLDAVITGSAVAIAQTGTVVLDGSPSCGRRAVHLIPDLHLVLVREEDLVDDVPAAVARLATAPGPLTWISGPSATSDIELNRVEGVHGPRQLHVIVITAHDRGVPAD